MVDSSDKWDWGELIEDVRTAYITRNIEDNSPEPILEDLAAEYEVPIAAVRAAFVRGDWDILRTENIQMFDKAFLTAREREIDDRALDLAKEMTTLMTRRLDFVKAQGLIIDTKIAAILSDPERDIKLQDLLKLKELTIKESMAITDTFIKIQDKLNKKSAEDEKKQLIGADYVDIIRTAAEITRVLGGRDTDDFPEAADVFKRLDDGLDN